MNYFLRTRIDTRRALRLKEEWAEGRDALRFISELSEFVSTYPSRLQAPLRAPMSNVASSNLPLSRSRGLKGFACFTYHKAS